MKLPLFFSQIVGSALICSSALAQVSYTEEGSEYGESFDRLARSGAAAWEDRVTVPGWSAFFTVSRVPERYVAYDGTASAGGLRSFGIIGTAERALGIAPGSHFGNGMVGVAIVNETGKTLRELSISYRGELWRGVGAGSKALRVEYRIGGSDAIGEGEWQAIDELLFEVPHGEGNMAYDGTLPENSSTLSATVQGVEWDAGETLYIRFSQTNDGSNKHLAIDDFSFSAK